MARLARKVEFGRTRPEIPMCRGGCDELLGRPTGPTRAQLNAAA